MAFRKACNACLACMENTPLQDTRTENQAKTIGLNRLMSHFFLISFHRESRGTINNVVESMMSLFWHKAPTLGVLPPDLGFLMLVLGSGFFRQRAGVFRVKLDCIG